MCVWLGSESGSSQSPSVLSVTAQRAGAGVSGLHSGRWEVAPVATVVGAAPLCLCLLPR